MSAYLFLLRVLFKRLLLVYALYTLCRLLFWIINWRYFTDLSSGEAAGAFFYGLLFDSSGICFTNCLFILMSVLPFSFVFTRSYQKLLKWLFILVNSLCLIVNCIDFAYFPFIKKRSTSDILNQVFGGQTDVMKQIPDYIKDFWYVILIAAGLIYLLIKIYSRISSDPGDRKFVHGIKPALIYLLGTLLIGGITLIGMRGGLQPIPLGIVDAGIYAKPEHVSLLLNTPFTIIKSLENQHLVEYQFSNPEEAETTIKPVKHFAAKTFTPQNVVILILESFSKEYTGISNRKSYTPFLDSLMQHGLVFTNAWANGTKSIEGIPSILASIPSLMDNPYVNSVYCNNKLNSFPSLLKQKGYTSAFFHGGKNGTMNFDAFARTVGFDEYFGKNEYANDSDFDGNWGIWDEPYLQYCAQKMNGFKEPFFASVFTLSSHHPYKVPEKYKGKFPKTDLEIIESIGYADYSLKQFFKTAKTMPWYSTTLFVLVADHTSISNDNFYANNIGQHTIPLVFFKGDNSLKGESKALIQQLDIMPSVLDLLGYNEPFFAFGQSVFSGNRSPYAVFFDSGNFYLANDSMYYAFNNFNPVKAIKFTNDSAGQKNSIESEKVPAENAADYLRRYMTLYSHCLIHNKTSK